MVTQYEMHGVEDLGLLKMDFLGLRNLDVMEIALDLIERSTGERPDIDNLPLDDTQTFALLRRPTRWACSSSRAGRCARCCARWRRDLRRRGGRDRALPAGADGAELAQRVRRPQERPQAGHLDHPDLEEILGPTFGLMIYQEQLMRASQKLAGYSLEEADNLRKATGKKIVRDREGARQVRRGLRAQRAQRRSSRRATSTRSSPSPTTRSTSRTRRLRLITYQTAWLKANYPVPYLAALLTSVKRHSTRPACTSATAAASGIEVLVPDVNASESDFAASWPQRARDAIRFGLSAVRNVGEGVAELIIEGAGRRPVRRLLRLLRAGRPGRAEQAHDRVVDQGGCVRFARSPAQGAARVFEPIVDATLRRRRERDQGTMSLFDLGGGAADDSPVFDDRLPIPDIDFDKSEKLRAEKEMLGLYVSDHPLMGAEAALRRLVECSITDLAELEDGTIRTVAGVVTGLARKYTKRGDLMATFVLEDLAAAIEVMVFPKTMLQYGELLDADAIVVIKGRIDGREDTPKLMAMEITRPELNLDGTRRSR